jgi:hypothetical protein
MPQQNLFWIPTPKRKHLFLIPGQFHQRIIFFPQCKPNKVLTPKLHQCSTSPNRHCTAKQWEQRLVPRKLMHHSCLAQSIKYLENSALSLQLAQYWSKTSFSLQRCSRPHALQQSTYNSHYSRGRSTPVVWWSSVFDQNAYVWSTASIEQVKKKKQSLHRRSRCNQDVKRGKPLGQFESIRFNHRISTLPHVLLTSWITNH